MFRMLELKPPNGWGAVAWELAIVVVGVFIALLAQQWADERSQRAKVRQSLAALRGELAEHYAWSVEWRVVQPCLVEQIDRLQKRVMDSGAQLQPAPTFREGGRTFVMRVPAKEYVTGAWQSAHADGVASRFEPAVRSELTSHFEQVRLIAEHGERNGIDYRRLLTLSRPMPLDPGVRYSIVQTLDELRGRVEFMDLLSGQLIDHIQRLGWIPDARAARREVERFGTYRYCRAQGLPLRSFEEAMEAVAN